MMIVRRVCFLVFICCQYDRVQASEFSWQGTLSFKSNYVFSTGVEIDDEPVMQTWLRASKDNGFYIDLWSNLPLGKGNPNRSAEIDFTLGRQFKINDEALFAASLSYYDIQDPDLFDFNRDVVGFNFSYAKGYFYSELSTYFVAQSEDGFRWANTFTKQVSDQWQMSAAFNISDGPYSREKAAVAKIALAFTDDAMFFDKISFELTDTIFKEDSNDDREFVSTVSLVKNLF